MFGGAIYFPVVVSLDYDPAADKVIPIWRAPWPCTIRAAYVTMATAVSGSTANYFNLQLYNGGTAAAGTATTQITSGTAIGTAGLAALTPRALTIASGYLATGSLVTLNYDEEGTGTFGQMIVQLDIEPGV